MSKLTKLLNSPGRFFVDAYRKRSATPPTSVFFIPRQKEGTPRSYVVGCAPWKRTLEGWFPNRELLFIPKAVTAKEFARKWQPAMLKDNDREILIWGLKAEPFVTQFAAEHRIPIRYLEDGFIRSVALGATKTPPFSLTIDTQTPYFDARSPSDLEDLLNTYDFEADPELLVRAKSAMRVLLSTGISKYNQATTVDIQTIYGPKDRKRILVVGQVEDDASIQVGSARAFNNNDAVMIAVMENPDAQVIYKPHPDVLHAHRKMLSNPDDVRHICQVLDQQEIPLFQAFETIDHVYTITSLSGFEALMRGIRVTTLGCPFYSGWGLTDERQPNPRRHRKLTVEQVFAGAYLLYAKYFDPIYKNPLTAEEAIERLVTLREFAHLRPPPAEAASAPPSEPPPQDSVPPPPGSELAGLREQVAALRDTIDVHALYSQMARLNEGIRHLEKKIDALVTRTGEKS